MHMYQNTAIMTVIFLISYITPRLHDTIIINSKDEIVLLLLNNSLLWM